MATHTADKILALAEKAMCTKGYASFSFRELAMQLGIKSASVHYHFPTKADLGLAVAKHYHHRYSEALEDIERQHRTAGERLQALVQMYRQELVTGDHMPLCCMLTAERQLLPEELRQELRAFYELNIHWLINATGQSKCQAAQVFALLQGAFMGGKALGESQFFDQVVTAIESVTQKQ
ncbi:TetR/AcrR family transcriptional regulator [Marinimicrobium sp. ABcell2]|uniref:TetR/AcrR family transcriptional regulator n=1 Tax=Marinimicrobium sp. ABcell2 TaxID=3069751 RepID=UPI0027B216E5|nr:TetR/AcrR family transcriptional regulator [Marinimicrobium sp. ABcell2]MDQ2075820.1 TetR/AcrR family transcriptional regulator [Marinimicrobium sp. ABcell2]